MTGVTGQGTTFNLPNFVGELFAISPTDTPFLSLIGDLAGGASTNATLFQWQGYDLRDASDTRQALEGANAPTAEERVAANVNNVVEIHHEAIEISYTKLAAVGQFNSTGSNHPGSVGIDGTNPVQDPYTFQVSAALKQIARDVEQSFVSGTFNNPSTNATARRTRGIIEATATNVSTQGTLIGTATIATTGVVTLAAHGLSNGDAVALTALTGGAVAAYRVYSLYYVKAVTTNTFELAVKVGGATITLATSGGAAVTEATPLTEGLVLDLLQDVWTAGGISEQETAGVMVGGTMKRGLTELFITRKNYRELSRNQAGVSVLSIETDFGNLSVVLSRYMPTGVIQVVSLEECSPVFLNIPGKGFLFEEPLATTGSATRSQIYGEVGLKYGNERRHGKLLNVSAPAPLV